MIQYAGSAQAARDILESQQFSLPGLFPQKADAISYLESSKLWILQPGLWVSSIAEPKLAVRKSELVDFASQQWTGCCLVLMLQ